MKYKVFLVFYYISAFICFTFRGGTGTFIWKRIELAHVEWFIAYEPPFIPTVEFWMFIVTVSISS